MVLLQMSHADILPLNREVASSVLSGDQQRCSVSIFAAIFWTYVFVYIPAHLRRWCCPSSSWATLKSEPSVVDGDIGVSDLNMCVMY